MSARASRSRCPHAVARIPLTTSRSPSRRHAPMSCSTPTARSRFRQAPRSWCARARTAIVTSSSCATAVSGRRIVPGPPASVGSRPDREHDGPNESAPLRVRARRHASAHAVRDVRSRDERMGPRFSRRRRRRLRARLLGRTRYRQYKITPTQAIASLVLRCRRERRGPVLVHRAAPKLAGGAAAIWSSSF